MTEATSKQQPSSTRSLRISGRRVGLDGVVNLGVRECLGEVQIILADDIKVDNEAGAVFSALLEEFADACGHLNPTPLSGRRRSRRGEPPMTLAMFRGCETRSVTAIAALVRMREIPFRTAGKDGQAFSVSPALAPAVIQKSPSVVALSRVASGELASPVSPPAAGRGCKEVAAHFLRRLSGLLSGCPPTDTRPQARAKLGKSRNNPIEPRRATLFVLTERKSGA